MIIPITYNIQNNSIQHLINKKTNVSFGALYRESDIPDNINDLIKDAQQRKFDEYDTLPKAYDTITTEYNNNVKKHKKSFFFSRSKVAKDQLIYYSKLEGIKAAENAFLKKIDMHLKDLRLIKKNLEAKDGAIDELNQLKNIEAQLLMAKEIKEAQLNSQIGLNSLGGYDEVKGFIRKIFINEVTKEKAKMQSIVPNAILLYGPTGCGKSKLVDAIASEIYPDKSIKEKYFINIDTSDDPDEVIDCINTALENAYENFKSTNNRTIILLDEIEAIANNKDPETTEAIKAALESANENYCTFFLTSNYPANINPDILGSNKVEYLIAIDPPDRNNMKAVLEYYFKRLSVKNIDYDVLVTELLRAQNDGRFSNSGIEHIYDICKDVPKLSQSDIIDVIRNTKPNILQSEYYNYINNKNRFEGNTYD